MKKSVLYTFGALLSASLLTGCLEETFPTNVVTSDQLSESTKAAEATLQGMAAQMSVFNVLNRSTNNEVHADYGYTSIMRIRDVMTADLAVAESNYDQYNRWETNVYMGPDWYYCQLIWSTYYRSILTANASLSGFPADASSQAILGYRGVALAQRAALYLDLARMYEYLPTDVTSSITADGNDILGLTVPIVTENTDQKAATDNPRVSHAKMSEFILGDLDEAETLISYAPSSSKTLPTLGVVYGLKARLYMWDENYAKAAEYARKAIDLGKYSPVTAEQWLDRATGFNTFNQSWMWGTQLTKEDDAVQTGICNWVAMSANEATYGYTGAGVFNMISKELYDKMSDNDFRKLSYKAPEGSPLSGKEPYIEDEESVWPDMPTYSSLKFRPGQGDILNYLTGNVVATPIMRIEEMYFIEAEAVAHSNPTGGKDLLEAFVTAYRDPSYVCAATDAEGVLEACFDQKRIELWGEGIMYFDYKRLNKSVTRAYEGTNYKPATRFNTNGRPAWMNICIVRNELQNNPALQGWNNPDPSDLYTAIK